jgi:hypothetical protein
MVTRHLTLNSGFNLFIAQFMSGLMPVTVPNNKPQRFGSVKDLSLFAKSSM